jgi:hypothetical protein
MSPIEPSGSALSGLLQSINAPNPADVPGQPDPETSLGIQDLKKAQEEAVLESYRQDTGERKRYAGHFFVLSCIWVGVIVAILLLQGFGSFWFGKMPFKLSEPVVLAVIGSTTLNILGILYIVANYLFPKKGLNDKP